MSETAEAPIATTDQIHQETAQKISDNLNDLGDVLGTNKPKTVIPTNEETPVNLPESVVNDVLNDVEIQINPNKTRFLESGKLRNLLIEKLKRKNSKATLKPVQEEKKAA